MKILAIDASTDAGSAALLENRELVGEILLRTRETHSSRLLPAVDQLLNSAKWSLHDLQAIAVTHGPGSFTGIRVSLTTAKTLAYTLKIAIFPISSLETLAGNVRHAPGLIAPAFDARKKEVFAAAYRCQNGQLASVIEPLACSPERLAELLLQAAQPGEQILLLGSSLRLYGGRLSELIGTRAQVAPPVLWTPRAAQAGDLIALRIAGGLEFERLDGLTEYARINPVYCRKSEAEIAWEQRPGQTFNPPI